MSAIAGILADRGHSISGSDPRDNAVLQNLRSRGVRVFREQSPATIDAIRSGTSCPPAVVVSSAVPANNPELLEAERAGLKVWHRSDVLAALIAAQPSISVAGSHGKTTTSTLVASLLHATNHDP
ncbi:MAG: Mur ligase domain-containing protein, partial [Vulcanococcus sp.]